MEWDKKTVPYTWDDFQSDTYMKYPTWLFFDPALIGLPHAAKTLYVYFLNRNRLSYINAKRFTDKQGNIFFICTRAKMQELLGCGYNQPRIYVEALKKYGLLREKRLGLNKPNRLYLLRPDRSKDASNPHKSRIHSISLSSCTDSVCLDAREECTLPIDKERTINKDVSLSVRDGLDRTERVSPVVRDEAANIPVITDEVTDEDIDAAEQEIKERIEYEDIVDEDEDRAALLDEFVSTIIDVIFTENRNVRIGGEDKPRALVKRNYKRLNRNDIERCLDQFMAHAEKIKKKPEYIRTMLYNAKLETDAHYSNLYSSREVKT